MLGYALRHWRGQQSLAWSFWFNLVVIRGLVFIVQTLIAPADGLDYSAYRYLALATAFSLHGVLLVWQVVGVIRSAESHFSQHGNMALVWGAQLGCVLMLVLSGVYALGAAQMTMQAPAEVDVLTQMNEEHARQYTLDVSADRQVVYISGMIDLGITRALRAYLLQHADVEAIVLDSDGGNIYEGRGLANLFSEHGLQVHVETSCASACTIAFSGGKVRTASNAAKFGFHQYRIDADYTIIATDVAKEQRRDQQRLLDAGVDARFVADVFSPPSASMWWPELETLLAAGFLHEIDSGHF